MTGLPSFRGSKSSRVPAKGFGSPNYRVVLTNTGHWPIKLSASHCSQWHQDMSRGLVVAGHTSEANCSASRICSWERWGAFFILFGPFKRHSGLHIKNGLKIPGKVGFLMSKTRGLLAHVESRVVEGQGIYICIHMLFYVCRWYVGMYTLLISTCTFVYAYICTYIHILTRYVHMTMQFSILERSTLQWWEEVDEE